MGAQHNPAHALDLHSIEPLPSSNLSRLDHRTPIRNLISKGLRNIWMENGNTKRAHIYCCKSSHFRDEHQRYARSHVVRDTLARISLLIPAYDGIILKLSGSFH